MKKKNEEKISYNLKKLMYADVKLWYTLKNACETLTNFWMLYWIRSDKKNDKCF